MSVPSDAASYPPSALPRGTRLGEFEVLDVLGVGGFGIVYLAMDHALEREVAIKEYMPSSLAGRTATLQVSLRSQSDAETFALGLRSFVNEAKLLARFDHPSLLKVYRFWEQNDTAYMAMPVYRGRTLKAVRQGMSGPPDEAWLRQVLVPLLGAIETLHHGGVFHRDIAPDNILIEPDGRPVLLDFGAARRVIGDRSQTLTAILKPAYAPIEQYAEVSVSRQGPWTDLYALGATLHYVLTGEPPPPATARTLHDDLRPLASRGLAGCSAELCAAVDWMLATRPADRPQSVAALRAVLDGQAAVPPPAVVAAAATAPVPAMTVPATQLDARPADVTVLDLSVPDAPAPAPAPAPSPDAAWPGARRSPRALTLLLGMLAVGAAAAWWWLQPASQATPGRMADGGATPAAEVGRALPDVAPVAVTADAPEPATARQQPTTVPPTTVPPAAAARPAPAAATVDRPVPRVAQPAAPAPVRDGTSAVGSPLADAPASASPAAGTSAAAAAAAPPLASTPAPIVTTVPVPAPAALSDDPSALCGRRVLVALFWCMERECARDDQKNHPACRKWFAGNRQRPVP
jgi:hypothetical protein